MTRELFVAVAFCLAAAFWILAAGPARACTVPDYAGGADPRLAGWQPCEELGTFNIQTPRGHRQVRMIADRNLPADWHEPARLVREAIVRSADTLREIGRGTVPNLLVLITGLLPSEEIPDPEDAEATAADRLTFMEGVANGRSGDQCLLVVYPANIEALYLRFVVAHEFFHCVQYALAGPQMAARDDDRPDRWWVEGTAEWFANLAYPELDASARYVARFDERTPDRSFTETAYDAFIYWSWYARQWSPADVLNFLTLTPTAGGEAAQKRAAMEMISDERWLTFVQDYLDRRVLYPDARRIPVVPREGEGLLWTESGEKRLEGERLALYRANLIFTCGDWTLESEGEEGLWKVRKLDEPGNWTELPERLEIAPGEEERFLLGGIGTGEEGFRLTIEATQEEDSREPCLCGDFERRNRGAERGGGRDSCLVGTWKLASGGLVEWLDRALAQVHRESGDFASYSSETTADESGRRLFIAEDGRWHYGANAVTRSEEAYNERGDRFASRLEAASGGAGYWATAGEILEICAVSEASGGHAELETPDGTMSMELPQYFTEHLYSGGFRYRCSAGSLHLEPHPGVPGIPSPMEWHYSKVE